MYENILVTADRLCSWSLGLAVAVTLQLLLSTQQLLPVTIIDTLKYTVIHVVQLKNFRLIAALMFQVKSNWPK